MSELELVWPRRFDLEAMRHLLGEDADALCCEVLAASVNAPVWTLLDRGGGRWRPAISRLAFLVSGGGTPVPEAVFQVAELLHTGSLIVDDIQDGGLERRGGPAAHVVHGTSAALNAANAAYFRALAVLRKTLPDAARLRALDMLSEELFAAHLGQALDLALGGEVRRGTIRLAHYDVLARAKTGALVRIAARLGAIAAAAPAEVEDALAAWASEVGLAYQICNDCDDAAGELRDVAAGRPTYPLLLALANGGAAAAAVRSRFGAALPEAAAAELRGLLRRERVVARALDAAEAAVGRALAALRTLAPSDARDDLARLTRELAAPPARAVA